MRRASSTILIRVALSISYDRNHYIMGASLYIYTHIYLSIYLSIYLYIYVGSPMGVEHSGEGIVGRRLHNAKLFERIEHSGSR